jgi:hypothetical protein
MERQHSSLSPTQGSRLKAHAYDELSGYDRRQFMRAITRAVAGVVVALALAYAADAAWVFLRTTNGRLPTRSVQVHVMLAVPQKNNRVEFIPGGTESQLCLQALFPHSGLEPCWYVERHTRREVDY